MARLILDTSVVVHSQLLGLPVDQLYDDDDDVAIAAITASELLLGVEMVHERVRARRAEEIEGLLAAMPIEDFDLDVSRAHAKLLTFTRRGGRQRGAHDLIIAATAVNRDRTVLTLDGRGFDELPGVSWRLAG